MASQVPNPTEVRDEIAIRLQLDRLLQSRAFKSTHRNSRFLAYLVERTLEGGGEALKERNVGTDVFGRAADYDTGTDNVVRTSAGELRKRLAQYYSEPGHEHELRIELPPGSYVPKFYAAPVLLTVPLPEVQVENPAEPVPRVWPWKKLGIGALAVCLAVAALLWRPWQSPSALDRFWEPMVASPGPVLICVGQISELLRLSEEGQKGLTAGLSARSLSRPAGRPLGFYLEHQVSIEDVRGAFPVVALLALKGKESQPKGMETVKLADLRDHAAVFIGDAYHDWINRLLGRARFYFDSSSGPRVIRDRKNDQVSWGVTRGTDQGTDYGLVLRAFDSVTGRPVVIATGLRQTGTEAAMEFLRSPALIEAATRKLSRNWSNVQLEFVLETTVIGTNQGLPRAVAVDSDGSK
jgi:hypothetical protein